MQPQLSTRKNAVHGSFWLALYALIWLILSGNDGWGFGIPLVLISTTLSLLLGLNPLFIHIHYLPGFMLLFLRELLKGGWDVARRAILPRLPVNPAWVEYPFSNPCPRNRLLLSTMVGLLPGTLASHIEGTHLHIHVLDKDMTWHSNVTQLEQALGKLLGDYPP